MAIFDHAHPKIVESTFSFPEFVREERKMTLFHLFIFESRDQSTPKYFDQLLIFGDYVSTCKKSVYIFHLFILQIQSILESHYQIGQTYF